MLRTKIKELEEAIEVLKARLSTEGRRRSRISYKKDYGRLDVSPLPKRKEEATIVARKEIARKARKTRERTTTTRFTGYSIIVMLVLINLD